jgi:hypothetical protein
MHGQARPRGMAIQVSLDLLETTRSVRTRSGSKIRQQRTICVLRKVYKNAIIRREGVCVRNYKQGEHHWKMQKSHCEFPFLFDRAGTTAFLERDTG